MRVSVKMERAIKKLAEKHSVDLVRPEAYLHLHNKPYMPLAIYNRGRNMVSVMHLNSDWMVDPEIVFWTGSTAGWVAIEVTQLIGGQRMYAVLNDECTELASIDVTRQASLTNFAELWAKNIVDQGWVEQSEKTQERFLLGHVVATPGALALLEERRLLPQTFIDRHVRGDWGELDEFDRQQNEQALVHRGRLLSRYVLAKGAVLWLITEGDRSATTLLTPAEY